MAAAADLGILGWAMIELPKASVSRVIQARGSVGEERLDWVGKSHTCCT